MQIKSGFKLRIFLLTGIAAALFCSGCNECDLGPPVSSFRNIELTPKTLELGPGEVGKVQARLLKDGKPGEPATWSLPDLAESPSSSKSSKSLASGTVSPSSGVNTTTVTLTARNDIELDGSYFLGNANEFRLDVRAENPHVLVRPNHIQVVVYDLKLGEVFRSLKPTYAAAPETVAKQRIARLDTDLQVEVKFDSSPKRYTFEVSGELEYKYYLKERKGSSLSLVPVTQKLGAPSILMKVGDDAKSARIEASGDFSGVSYPKDMSNQEVLNQQVDIILTVIAHGPGGRDVKGIFHLTKVTIDTNCLLC